MLQAQKFGRVSDVKKPCIAQPTSLYPHPLWVHPPSEELSAPSYAPAVAVQLIQAGCLKDRVAAVHHLLFEKRGRDTVMIAVSEEVSVFWEGGVEV